MRCLCIGILSHIAESVHLSISSQRCDSEEGKSYRREQKGIKLLDRLAPISQHFSFALPESLAARLSEISTIRRSTIRLDPRLRFSCEVRRIKLGNKINWISIIERTLEMQDQLQFQHFVIT
jgi:hypothetical protein